MKILYVYCRMTNNSQKALRGTMKEVLLEVLPTLLDDLKMNFRDEIYSIVKASEAGLIRRMDAMEARLISRMDSGFDSMNELIDDGILPQINDCERDILMIKTHLNLA